MILIIFRPLTLESLNRAFIEPDSRYNFELETNWIDSEDFENEIVIMIPVFYCLKCPRKFKSNFCRGSCKGMDAVHQNRKKSPITHCEPLSNADFL